MAESTARSHGPTRELDNLITGLLVFLVGTLPFAVTDFSTLFSLLCRLLLFGTGCLCAISASLKASSQLQLRNALILSMIIGLHTLISMLRVLSFDYAKELGGLISFIFMAVWARDVRTGPLAKGVIAIALFYCADVLYQYATGVDWFGFSPRNNRIWGPFYFGAPTFGAFLSFVLVLPWFYIKRTWLKLLLVAVFAVTLFVANDRAPVVQSLLAVLLFAPFRTRYRVLAIGCALAPMMVVTAVDPLTSNRVAALYVGLRLLVTDRSSPELWDFLSVYGIVGYLEIWGAVVSGWFTWTNLPNVLFGTGWGSVMDELRLRVRDFSRPHSIHIDLLVSWGVVGYAVLLGWVLRLYRRNRETFVILAPCVLPFGFFSLTSSNYLFMIAISYVLFIGASRQRQRSKVGTPTSSRASVSAKAA